MDVLGSEPPTEDQLMQVMLLLGAIIALGLCYIFYPAYRSLMGSVSCRDMILVGGVDDYEGEILLYLITMFNNYIFQLTDLMHQHFIITGNTLSLVIPAYNEEERLPIMLEATLDYLTNNRNMLCELFKKILGSTNGGDLKYELIVVDDGSKDNTISVVKEYTTTVTRDTIKLVSMTQNSGKGAAVMAGMLRASGQLCLMLDADGATDISDGLFKVMKEMEAIIKQQNSDSLPPAAVFGSRAHLEETSSATRSKVRTLLMHAFHFFVKNLCSAQIKDTQCGFKLFTRPAVVKLFSNLHLRRW